VDRCICPWTGTEDQTEEKGETMTKSVAAAKALKRRPKGLLALAAAGVATIVLAACGSTSSAGSSHQQSHAPTHAPTTAPAQSPALPTHAPTTAPAQSPAPPTHPPTTAPAHSVNPIPQGNGGDGDADNNGGPSDGDGNI
jgi:hypothetical protein